MNEAQNWRDGRVRRRDGAVSQAGITGGTEPGEASAEGLSAPAAEGLSRIQRMIVKRQKLREERAARADPLRNDEERLGSAAKGSRQMLPESGPSTYVENILHIASTRQPATYVGSTSASSHLDQLRHRPDPP